MGFIQFSKKIGSDGFSLQKLIIFAPLHAKWPCSLMDRASDYGSEGWGFESLQGHKLIIKRLQRFCKRFFFTICTQFAHKI